jgi:endonuclease-3
MARKGTGLAAKAAPLRIAGIKGANAVARADALVAAGKIKRLSKAEIEEAFRRWRAANPHPKGELEHINPFTLLVAVALSAQSTDVGVNKATRNIFPKVDTAEKMLTFGENRLRDAIKTIGFFNVKAKNVIALARKLVAEHGGDVPHDRAALEALPGVGRKTANVVLNIAFGEPTIAVDTHVFRVSNRTGLASGKSPLEVELRLIKVVPDDYKPHAHHWLILHGRYICKAVRPLCEQCLINDLCRWPGKLTFLGSGKREPPLPKGSSLALRDRR